MAELTDEMILEMITDEKTIGDGFRHLFRKYREPLYQHIRRMVWSHEYTDEIIQLTFIKAWKGIPNFRRESKLYTWLYTIATRETLNFLEREKKHISFDMDISYANVPHADNNGFTGDEIQKKLLMAIQTLPVKQRSVFVMRYFDEMSYDDIAAITSTSIGALKASYHHSVKKVEEYFKSI